MNVKFVCPSCGVELAARESVCPSCRTPIEWPPEMTGASGGPTVALCPVCGFNNLPGTHVCKSCGAKLPAAASKGPPKGSLKQGIRGVPGGPVVKGKRGGKKVDWQVIAPVVVILAAVVIYFVLSQKKEPKSSADVHANVPAETQGMITQMQELKVQVERNPADMQSTLRLANLMQDAQMYDQAITYYRKYLEKNAKNPDARVDMAVCFFQKGDSKTAIDEIENALKDNPRHQQAYFNLGIITLTGGDPVKANEYFNKVVSIDPNTDVAKRAQEIMKQHSSINMTPEAGK
ncbi:MAG: hypothetical protein COS95_08570 [Ignavibacteriales bacterium CG07_land_8_20_14_0_80_59_12]|nr:MAG: hypothetical protein COS95_08570 [Ignavibacteriales bacterium CG07_land_8_20_14_0_80_59_12]